MTGRAREQLAADLAPDLADNYTIVPDPRKITGIDPGKRGVLQIVRDVRRTNPAAPQAQYLETFHLWVITPLAEQPTAENDLDDSLDEVRAALESLSQSAIEEEKRMRHPDGFNAYRITATYTTDKEQ